MHSSLEIPFACFCSKRNMHAVALSFTPPHCLVLLTTPLQSVLMNLAQTCRVCSCERLPSNCCSLQSQRLILSYYRQSNISYNRIKTIACNNMWFVHNSTVNPKNAALQPLLICIVNFIKEVCFWMFCG